MRALMDRQRVIWTTTLTLALALTVTARAADAMKYPDWSGQWLHTGVGGQFDPSKPPRLGQHPPLTPEYQAIWEANLKEADEGGQNYNPQAHCLPGGMPRLMMALEPMEFIVTPNTTYVETTFNSEFRRIYTDGRDWPTTKVPPSFSGYSIGKWIDQDGDGRYDALEVETRGLRGPRHFDSSGIPMHRDNQTVIKERFYPDKSDANVIYDEITTIDHALTRPWAVTRGYRRSNTSNTAVWIENTCLESNQYVFIGGESYLVSVDGFLMPVRKNEPPPNLRNFTDVSK